MKILFIHADPDKSEFYNDYLSDLLLHGLREIYGEDVIDYPGSWYLYKDEIIKKDYDKSKLWGKGFTVCNTLDNFRSFDRTDLEKKIKNKYFELVIFGSIRRSQKFLDLVKKMMLNIYLLMVKMMLSFINISRMMNYILKESLRIMLKIFFLLASLYQMKK